MSDVTLKEFVSLRFDGLDEKVVNLDKKVGDLDERVKALEDCINNEVRHVVRMWRNIGRTVVAGLVAMVVAVAVAWLRQMLGL